MDMLTVAQMLWSCAQDKYPEIGGALLQVIGGATVLFRVLGSQKVGTTSSTGFGMGKLLGWLGKIAMNK